MDVRNAKPLSVPQTATRPREPKAAAASKGICMRVQLPPGPMLSSLAVNFFLVVVAAIDPRTY
jgi:hypothetical protein